MAQDRIQIVEPNGIERTRPLTEHGLTIGRVYENDLMLAYPTVSRHHARVSFDGQQYVVTDLGSGNGTFLDDVRLPPNTPTPWQNNQTLRIGNIVIRLIQSEVRASGRNQDETFVWTQQEAAVYAGQTARRRWPPWVWALIAMAVLLALAAVWFILQSG